MSRLVGRHVQVAERLLGFIEREMRGEESSVIASALSICREHLLAAQRQRRTPAASHMEDKSDVGFSVSHS